MDRNASMILVIYIIMLFAFARTEVINDQLTVTTPATSITEQYEETEPPVTMQYQEEVRNEPQKLRQGLFDRILLRRCEQLYKENKTEENSTKAPEGAPHWPWFHYSPLFFGWNKNKTGYNHHQTYHSVSMKPDNNILETSTQSTTTTSEHPNTKETPVMTRRNYEWGTAPIYLHRKILPDGRAVFYMFTQGPLPPQEYYNHINDHTPLPPPAPLHPQNFQVVGHGYSNPEPVNYPPHSPSNQLEPHENVYLVYPEYNYPIPQNNHQPPQYYTAYPPQPITPEPNYHSKPPQRKQPPHSHTTSTHRPTRPHYNRPTQPAGPHNPSHRPTNKPPAGNFPRTPNLNLPPQHNQQRDPLYKEEMKFVLPLTYPILQRLALFPWEVDQYAYQPAHLRPTYRNITIPYQPTYHMIRTLSVPDTQPINDDQ